ncbi:hypothetical protein BTE77_27885 [Ensifer adhaerens]|nr:hypothetical protein BTE77_27885 [Ensifer adhaerens]
MSAIASVLVAAAGKIGAPLVTRILKDTLGGRGSRLADAVIDEVASTLGVAPKDIPSVPAPRLEAAVAEVEACAPELVAIWQRGIEGQFELLQTETREGFWQSFWRWGWMYLLAFLWVWRIIMLPVAAVFGWRIEAVDYAVLMTLTGWFMSLYMGGHTVKELGKSALDAVRTWKAKT